MRQEIVIEVIRLALMGENHRDVVVDKIDEAFVEHVLEFFQQVVIAKIRNEDISANWYKDHFLDEDLDKTEIAWNSGINIKTVDNKRGTTRKSVVIEEAALHQEKFIELIDSLTADEDIDINLSLTMGSVTVHLTLNETLVVINALAVRRAAIRGGAWSAIGKRVEGPLMETLCRLFNVNRAQYARAIPRSKSMREVDYYLLPPDGRQIPCEVKLMGKGNPESADGALARASLVFVASTLSETNTTQLDEQGILWTELQTPNGFLRFRQTLQELGIPYSELPVKSDYSLDIEHAVDATFS